MTEITGRLRDVRGTHVEEFSVEGAPPRGLRQYRPDRVRVEFTSFAPVGGDRPSGVKVTLFGPVLKKDGTDSKRRTSEVFLTRRVTSVPSWTWAIVPPMLGSPRCAGSVVTLRKPASGPRPPDGSIRGPGPGGQRASR